MVVSLTPRETRERALLAMCISDPAVGRNSIDRLTEEHVSPSGAPALGWLRGHLEDPMAELPREDAALTSLITELVMKAESEPATEGAMQLNFDLLELQRLEDGISAAQQAGDYEVSTRLSGERAKLTERIAHAGVRPSRLRVLKDFRAIALEKLQDYRGEPFIGCRAFQR